LGADVQSNKTVLAIGAGTALLAGSLVAPSAARAYRAWEVERRQTLIAAAIDAARRGDDSLPSIPLADPDVVSSASSDVAQGAEPEAGEREDASLRAAYAAAELGIRTPAVNAELARIAQQETQRWLGLGNDSAIAATDQDPSSPTVQGNAPWRSMGPYWARTQFNGFYYSAADTGRVMTVKVHPTNSSLVYVGTSGGGIWKNASFNNSSRAASSTPTWVPLTDSLGSLAIGGFDLAPSNPSVLYVGLGDAFDQQLGGWAKSLDGGTTWTAAQMLTAVHPADGVTVFAQHVREVTVDPNNADHVFFTTDAGLFVTTNGGDTFTIAALPKSAPYATSREGTWSIAWMGGTSWIVSGVYACPGFNGPNVALQMFGATSCPAPNAAVPGNRGDIWRSSDNGATWTSIRDSGELAPLIAAAGAAGIGRMELTVAAATDPTPARVYALVGSQNESSSSTIGIIRSDDGGQTWTLKARVSAPATTLLNTTNPASGDCTNMNLGHSLSYYDLAIAVDPGNPDRVIAAGNLCSVRSRDGGASWENASHWLPAAGGGTTARGPLPYVHADWHTALVSRVGGQVVVFAGSDGGLFVSRDLFDRDFAEQVHWDSPDYGITTHLMYSVGSGDPTTGNPSMLYSGLQDNGTRWLMNGDNQEIFSVELKVWDQLIGGDGIGTAVALDPTGKNPTLWASGSVQPSRRFCRPRSRDCGKATRLERGTERNNWPAVSLASALIPLGDGEPFFTRYADLGDGWVLSASNQNLWRLRSTETDSVQFARLTTGVNPTITGCGSTAARNIRGIGPTASPQYTLDGVTARLYGLPLNGGCFAIVTDKNPSGGTVVTTTTTGVPVSMRAKDANGNTVLVSFTSSVAFPRSASSLGGTDPRQSFVVSSNAPAALDANSFAVLPLPAEVGRIFKTVDGGATWIPFHGNGTSDLPNVPVYVVRYDYSDTTDQTLYAATELGLYRTTDGGETWARLGVGLPLVRVTDVYISRNGSVVRASTFGRGMWEIHVKSEASQVAGNGDYDGNGVIDWFDLSALATRMGVPPLTNPALAFAPWYDSNVDLGGANPALIQEDDLAALLVKFGGAP
jgi:hypothetical protein